MCGSVFDIIELYNEETIKIALLESKYNHDT